MARQAASPTLVRLGEEALRLSRELAALAEAEAPGPPGGAGAGGPGAAPVRRLIEARQLRTRHFGRVLAPEPGWTLMLVLCAARLAGAKVTPSRLARQAALPVATVLRRLAALESQGLVERAPDPARRRGILVALTADSARRMEDYLKAAREI